MLTGADPGLILGSCKILQKKLEHRNDAICRIIIDSGNTNCLGTWTFFFRGTFIWTSLPGKLHEKQSITIRCVKSKGFYCRLF